MNVGACVEENLRPDVDNRALRTASYVLLETTPRRSLAFREPDRG